MSERASEALTKKVKLNKALIEAVKLYKALTKETHLLKGTIKASIKNIITTNHINDTATSCNLGNA